MQKDIKGNMITRLKRVGNFRELVLYDSIVLLIVTQTSTGNCNKQKIHWMSLMI